MKRNKAVAATLAAALAVTGLLAGTYAWQSISQKAKNEISVSANPGARLHDDFIYAGKEGNKDVYAENFTKVAEDGEAVFARIRLDEYMEIGKDAGITVAPGTTKNVTVVTDPSNPNPDFENTGTWTTYLWEREKMLEDGQTITSETSAFRNYMLWETGGSTVYMPTYNMNRDSLESDINGTLAGINGTAYDDYVSYTLNGVNGTTTSFEDDYEITDIDEDANDEAARLFDDYGVTLDNVIAALDADGDGTLDATLLTLGSPAQISVGGQQFSVNVIETSAGGAVEAVEIDIDPNVQTDLDIQITGKVRHTAKQTLSSTLISMDRWLDDGAMGYNAQPGPYWVYDEDGWVYWAEPIEPETATGLLLDEIKVRPDAALTGKYYYSINVVSQFASVGDWGSGTPTTISRAITINQGNGTGFYKDGITENALFLLETISGTQKTVEVTMDPIPADGLTGETGKNTATFQAVVKMGATELSDGVTWTMEGNETAGSDGTQLTDNQDGTATLTIGEKETAKTINIVATTVGTNQAVGSCQVAVHDWYTVNVSMEAGSSQYIGQGSVRNFKAVVTKRGVQQYGSSLVSWAVESIDPAHATKSALTQITTEGVLKIGQDEEANDLRVTATVKENTNVSSSVDINHIEDIYDYIENHYALGTNETVNIDGYEWYVLDVTTEANGDKIALLWVNTALRTMGDDGMMPFAGGSTGNVIWQTSDIRAYLNGTFYNELQTLQARILDTPLKTRDLWNSSNYLSTTDKVFLFTEADIFGTVNGAANQVTADDYTFKDANGDGINVLHHALAKDDPLTTGVDEGEEAVHLLRTSLTWNMLRSPRTSRDYIATITGAGTVSHAAYWHPGTRYRPALRIKLN